MHAPPPSPRRILVADDDSLSLEFMQNLLQRGCPGAEVFCFLEPAAALAELDRSAFDLAVLDVKMPHIDGFELCRRIKANPQNTDMPVLLISGYLTDPHYRARGLDCGADGYLCKPFAPEEFIAIANTLLRLKDKQKELKQQQETLERAIERVTLDHLQSEGRFHTLFEQSPDAVWVEDLSGRILEPNAAACRLCGLKRAELVGQNAFELVSADQRALADLHPRQWQEGLLRRRGVDDTIPIEFTAGYIDYGDQPARVLHVRDIAARRQAEAREAELRNRLVRAERMESIGLLAGGVAHDLNNILGPLVGYPDLLLEGLAADFPHREELMEMKESAQRATALIQDLLILSRGAGQQRSPMDLNRVIASFMSGPRMKTLAREHPRIVFRLGLCRTPLIVVCAETHLVRTLYNLVLNACEAMAEGGELTISTRREALARAREGYESIVRGDYAVLSVADTGHGIEAANLERIFEPFYTSRNGRRVGTGLGLAVVYGIVKDLGGCIDVQSTVGQGTRFSLYFPAPEAELDVLPTCPPVEGGDETLLIVDDLAEACEIAARLLRKLGYTTCSARNRAEALEQLRQRRVDLVLMDIVLGEGDSGIDFYKELRAAHPGLRAVFTSGYTTSPWESEIRRLALGGFVQKPYTIASLGGAVRRELDRAPVPR